MDPSVSTDPAPTACDDGSGTDDVALAAQTVAAAVAAARLLVDEAATAARHLRDRAAREAAELAADQAVQDATATRYRTEAAASLIQEAAVMAAATVRRGEVDPISYGAQRRASDLQATVQAAALALADADAAVEAATASAVARRAELVARIRLSLDLASEIEVAAAAAAVDVLATQAAALLDPGSSGTAC